MWKTRHTAETMVLLTRPVPLLPLVLSPSIHSFQAQDLKTGLSQCIRVHVYVICPCCQDQIAATLSVDPTYNGAEPEVFAGSTLAWYGMAWLGGLGAFLLSNTGAAFQIWSFQCWSISCGRFLVITVRKLCRASMSSITNMSSWWSCYNFGAPLSAMSKAMKRTLAKRHIFFRVDPKAWHSISSYLLWISCMAVAVVTVVAVVAVVSWSPKYGGSAAEVRFKTSPSFSTLRPLHPPGYFEEDYSYRML